MNTKNRISRLTIKGFKSIKNLEELPLNNLNILIGANGAGKSNFVSYFRLLGEIVQGRLQQWTTNQGSADRIVSFGIKETPKFESVVEFGQYGYMFELTPDIDSGFSFAQEQLFFGEGSERRWFHLGSGQKEARLNETFKASQKNANITHCFDSIMSWKVFHFHDTSDTAGVKRLCSVHDNEYLRSDASNLAAFLYKLTQQNLDTYEQIRKVVQLAIPFFDNFVLKPQILPTEEGQIRLLWKQKNSDYPFWPSQLSDGSVRFICLATALLQPNPPSTMIIDEPELGLHPYAIELLASLIRSASKRMQVIISTQSVSLVNEFSIEDLIVVDREQNMSVFKHFSEKDLKGWLEEYSLGELWEKNILGGRPSALGIEPFSAPESKFKGSGKELSDDREKTRGPTL